VFQKLVALDAIRYTHTGIYVAGLNVRHYPAIRPFVEIITKDLFARVVAAGISYDAVVSVPSGGDEWSKAFANVVLKRERRHVPFLRLIKDEETGELTVRFRREVATDARLLIVDDTIYLGETAEEIIKVLRRAGYKKIAAFVSPVVIGTVGSTFVREMGYPLISTFDSEFVATLR
jgi:orotate phosphoribosyltransferase